MEGRLTTRFEPEVRVPPSACVVTMRPPVIFFVELPALLATMTPRFAMFRVCAPARFTVLSAAVAKRRVLIVVLFARVP